MSNYKIKSNLSEKQVEADVSCFFGWISKDSPFRLLDVDEQLTGADKRFYNQGFAYFIQFKRSEGLEPLDRISASTRRNRSPLEDIREFRNQYELEDDPSLYFELRSMSPQASDFQHNILLSYANNLYSQAFYVAPLHLDKNVYYNCLFDSANRFRFTPFETRNYRLFRKNWVSHFGNIPFLKEHVSIIPHERVTTHKHYYSYSINGCDIAWHSPDLLSKGPSRLSDVLGNSITEIIDSNHFLHLEELAMQIVEKSDIPFRRDIEPLVRIQHFGRYIHYIYGIRLILLLGNKDYINQYLQKRNQ